jgi:hypothetical protein
MDWKRVDQEKPPLQKHILIGTVDYYGDSNNFKWKKGYIYRPFDSDKEMNPNIYKVIYFCEHAETSKTETLSPYMFWCDVEVPKHPDLEKKK